MIEKILDRFAGIHRIEWDDEDHAWNEAVLKCERIVQEESKNDGWIPCSEQMPPKTEVLLLVQCSGKPRKNVILRNAFELAIYDGQRWHFPMYPVWDDAEVIAWQPLPAPYQKGDK